MAATETGFLLRVNNSNQYRERHVLCQLQSVAEQKASLSFGPRVDPENPD